MREHDRPARPPGEHVVAGSLPEDARRIFGAALRAVQPEALLGRSLSLEGEALRLGPRRFPLPSSGRVVVVAAGKAAAGLAAAAETLLGDRIVGGLVLAVEGTERPLRRLRCYPCPHPVPDGRSAAGTRQLLEAVSGLSAGDLVLALWSGGGSACLGLPVDGLRVEEVAETTRLMLSAHFQIQQVNQVRRACLQAADGGVARAAAPARVLAAVLCDAPLADVASGPTLPGGAGLEATLSSLRNWGVWDRLPEGVRRRLDAFEGVRRAVPLDRERVFNFSIGGNADAVQAALAEARAMGYEAEVADQPLQWEARMAGTLLARQLRALSLQGGRPRALIAGGETTVAVKGPGRGGRNQELAAAAALDLAGAQGVALLAGATDGVDGSSDAAGAVVTGGTCAEETVAASVRQALEWNDTHAFFLDRPERLVTGPTGTNVADLAVGLMAL